MVLTLGRHALHRAAGSGLPGATSAPLIQQPAWHTPLLSHTPPAHAVPAGLGSLVHRPPPHGATWHASHVRHAAPELLGADALEEGREALEDGRDALEESGMLEEDGALEEPETSAEELLGGSRDEDGPSSDDEEASALADDDGTLADDDGAVVLEDPAMEVELPTDDAAEEPTGGPLDATDAAWLLAWLDEPLEAELDAVTTWHCPPTHTSAAAQGLSALHASTHCPPAQT